MAGVTRRHAIGTFIAIALGAGEALNIPRVLHREAGLEQLAESTDKAQAYADEFQRSNPSEFIDKIQVMWSNEYHSIAGEFERAFSEYFVNAARDDYLQKKNPLAFTGLAAKLQPADYHGGMSLKRGVPGLVDEVAWELSGNYQSRIIWNHEKRKKEKNPVKARIQTLRNPGDSGFWTLEEYLEALKDSSKDLEYDDPNPNLNVPRLERTKDYLRRVLRNYFARFNDAGFLLLPTNSNATRFVAFVSPILFDPTKLNIYEPSDLKPFGIDAALNHVYTVAAKIATRERMIDWTSTGIGEDLEANGLENLAERDARLSSYGMARMAANPSTVRTNLVHDLKLPSNIGQVIYDHDGIRAWSAADEFGSRFSEFYVTSKQFSREALKRLVRDHPRYQYKADELLEDIEGEGPEY
ncbi:hypothetical protein HY637_00135 [Candidatus Woesearchaeota archaeon]|nr:hypothetical protein [Candidatus Woesearchaeota archaeon]